MSQLLCSSSLALLPCHLRSCFHTLRQARHDSPDLPLPQFVLPLLLGKHVFIVRPSSPKLDRYILLSILGMIESFTAIPSTRRYESGAFWTAIWRPPTPLLLTQRCTLWRIQTGMRFAFT